MRYQYTFGFTPQENVAAGPGVVPARAGTFLPPGAYP
jgi:hypothetical protein